MAASAAAAVSLKAPMCSFALASSSGAVVSSPNHAKIGAVSLMPSWGSDIRASRGCSGRVHTRKPAPRLVAMAVAPEDLTKEVAQSIEYAKEVCAGDAAGECAAAWDTVEELSAVASDKRQQAKAQKDPLEAFCKDNPETDECRVYED